MRSNTSRSALTTESEASSNVQLITKMNFLLPKPGVVAPHQLFSKTVVSASN